VDTAGIGVGDGRVLGATHKEVVKFDVDHDAGSVILFSLSNVLHIPRSSSSLILWRQIAFKCRMGGEVFFLSLPVYVESQTMRQGW